MQTGTISGLEKVRFKLKELDKKVQDKLSRESITASLKVIAKAIKSEVPSGWKEGRKAIGWSFRKGGSRSRHSGVTFAKAGVGAGVKKARRMKGGKSREGRKGVGQSASNFHWFVLGTKERSTGSKRAGAHKAGAENRRVPTGGKIQRTGKLKPNAIVKRGSLKSKAAALAAMAKTLQAGIERETAKK